MFIIGAAAKLPKNAPSGGIEPVFCIFDKFNYFKLIYNNLLAHEAIFAFGKISGSKSLIDGTAGAEKPLTIPMHRKESDTQSESITYKV